MVTPQKPKKGIRCFLPQIMQLHNECGNISIDIISYTILSSANISSEEWDVGGVWCGAPWRVFPTTERGHCPNTVTHSGSTNGSPAFCNFSKWCHGGTFWTSTAHFFYCWLYWLQRSAGFAAIVSQSKPVISGAKGCFHDFQDGARTRQVHTELNSPDKNVGRLSTTIPCNRSPGTLVHS